MKEKEVMKEFIVRQELYKNNNNNIEKLIYKFIKNKYIYNI